MDFEVRPVTKLLLVDDDVQQLKLKEIIMKRSGFTVLTASSPLDAISIMADTAAGEVDVAIFDYNMPDMNGCVLAECLRCRHPDLKIILHSGAVDIPDGELDSVDVWIPKMEGVRRLLEQVSRFAGPRTSSSSRLTVDEKCVNSSRCF